MAAASAWFTEHGPSWAAAGVLAAASLSVTCCALARAHGEPADAAELRAALEQERAAHGVTESKRKQEKAGRGKAEREKRSQLRQSNAAAAGTLPPLPPPLPHCHMTHPCAAGAQGWSTR